jgi:hypothetical protein
VFHTFEPDSEVPPRYASKMRARNASPASADDGGSSEPASTFTPSERPNAGW